MTYSFALENFRESLPDLMPLYRQHYAEMQARLASDGIDIPDFNPRVSEYQKAADAGYLLNYVVRIDGQPVGYSNVYLTNDMHNSEFMATEDTIFIVKEHRNGVGRKLVRAILEDLKRRGVKRVMVSPVTDLRVGKIWERMGFKPVAQQMTYVFEDN